MSAILRIICLTATILVPIAGRAERVTLNNYYFSATSAQGAVGDIVAVEVLLTVDGAPWKPYAVNAVGCFDPSVVEIVGEPVFSEEFEAVSFMRFAVSHRGVVGPTHPDGLHGFSMISNLLADLSEPLLSSGVPLSVGFLYFRIVGQPEDEAEIRFCDSELEFPGGATGHNELTYIDGYTFGVLSERHVSGTIRVLPGEATQTELPTLPPAAKVYAEPPTPETADIRFELSGALARPGSTDVPLRLFVTSAHEFPSFCASLSFPPSLLEVTRVLEPIRPGVVSIDNDSGSVGILLSDNVRRIGREGERVHVATLYVDVKDVEDPPEEIHLEFERRGSFLNWVGVRSEQGVSVEEYPITMEVTPILLLPGVLALQLEATTAGDVNLDYGVDLSDAVALLSHLFQGDEEPICSAAADVYPDGTLNLSDAIAILQGLFLDSGGTFPGPKEVYCDP